MRVIGGHARGRRLAGPPVGAATRPTSDKVRQALFNVLGERVHGARVLDLFAGTGALGIEALSRGAAKATFVESNRALCGTIDHNLAALGLTNEGIVLCRDVRRVTGQLASQRFDVVLIDPPYGLGLEREALTMLAQKFLLAPGAIVVLEHASRESPPMPAQATDMLTLEQTRTYGDTALTIYLATDIER